MKNISATITPPNTIEYPLHQHNKWEIMYYLSGDGVLATEEKDIPFKSGSIIIVPPKTVHGSISKKGFVNISISGDFEGYFMFNAPVLLEDNQYNEGKHLSSLIFNNRYADTAYLSALCTAYVCFLLQNVECKSGVRMAVSGITTELTENFSDSQLDVCDILKKSGYAEDYIRSEFKKQTGLTPVQFLTKTRIEHARQLLEIYGHSITVNEVMLACGFEDLSYFSRRFKQFIGCSPYMYKKGIFKGLSYENNSKG